MNKIEYIAQVRDAVRTAARRKYAGSPGQVSAAVVRLAELYVSISEADELPRYEYDPAIFERAYDAATYQPNDSSPKSSRELREAASVGPNYARVRESTPEILKSIFTHLRRQQS